MSDRFLTRWVRALIVLASAIAVFVASGDDAFAARSKKKATKRPAAKAKPHAPAKAPPPAPVEPAPAADPVAPPVDAAPQPAAAAATPPSAPAEPAPAKRTIVIIIEGTNARELDKALRNALVSSVNVAAPGVTAESVTLAEQQTFDRPKNKREVVKAARKVAKRAKVDGVIYANVGGSTSKGYSAATLLVYKNGKVGADASIPVAKTTRKGKRQILHWNYAQVIAAVQPGLESFPADAAPESAPEQQSLGDAMAAFDAERGDEPVMIEAGDVVATAPVEGDGLYYRRIRAPIHLKVGIEGGHRSFSYNQPITSNLRDYSVGFVPLIHLEGEAFPFGNTDVAFLKNLGWYGMYERAIGVESSFQTSEDNVRVSNTWASWQVGIHSRFNVTDKLTLGPQITYGYFAYRFNFNDLADQRSLEVPDVRYNFLRLGLEARAPLFMFDIAGGVGYNDVLSGGRVASQFFPNSSTRGVDAYLTLGFPLTEHIALDGTVRYNRWFYSMNPELGDTYIAGGAIDQYLMASLNFVYMFGAHNEQ